MTTKMRTTRTIVITGALVAAVSALACSQVLGLKDPTLDEEMGNTQKDAAIDAVPADAPPDTAPAGCVPANCPFGCDPDSPTHACRPAKLFVYLTIGAFFGNGFIGSPADVRGTADALCFDTFAKNYANRACTKARTHAILSVSGGDSIQLMASTYSVPTTAEVHRIDDDLLISDNWNDLTSTTKAPRARVVSTTMAASDADGIAWTGFGPTTPSNCVGWTSKLSTDNGVQAHPATDNGTAPAVGWLGTGSSTCNFTQRLLCVCWTGGN